MKTKTILIIIFCLSFLIRFVYVRNYPPVLWDEAAIGYNAFSILKTGKDEYGQFFPLVFRSFGDYKPGLYIYTTIPFVAIFGLNTLAVRLPSVLAGSLLPLLIFWLIIRLSPKSVSIALISAFVTAFNPWNIHFSRGGWETNLMLFELLLALILYLHRRYFWSSLFFAMTLYTYQAGKIISPLLILILFYLSINFRSESLKKTLTPLLTKFTLPLFLLSLPLIFGLIFNSESSRLQVFSLWSYHRPETEVNQIIAESNNLDYQLFHSEPLFFLKNFFIRYLNHFSPRFLTFEGDWQISRHSAPYNGVLLYPSIIFLIIGFLAALSDLSLINRFFILWLLIGPLPAALTRDIIQPVRCLNLSIPLIYFISVGVNLILQKYRYLLIKILLLLVFILSFIYYTDLYYVHMTKIKPDHWLYGYQSAMEYTINHQSGKSVTFTTYYGQPYIYYLYFSQYSPSHYQSQANLVQTGLDVGRVNQIDNIEFSTPDFARLRNLPNQLIILSWEDALRQGIDLNLLKPLSPINGISTFYAYET